MANHWNSEYAIWRDLSVAQGREVPAQIDNTVAKDEEPPSLLLTGETEEEFFGNYVGVGDDNCAPDLKLIQMMLQELSYTQANCYPKKLAQCMLRRNGAAFAEPVRRPRARSARSRVRARPARHHGDGENVAISSPKICIKSGDNEMYRPQVTSPFYLSLNEGSSDMNIFDGNTFGSYLPLLHIPTKPCAGYCGLSEVLKITEQTNNVYVDLLIVVKAVKPARTIKTKAGADMTVRAVEIMDNTTPASLILDIFDIDTIQRAEQWRPLESVLFIADARVSWRSFAVRVQTCSRSVVTHQPHTSEAEALRLYIRNQANTRGGEAAAWAAWSGERANSASVSQIRDRLSSGVPFCAALHALLTHLDLDEFATSKDGNLEELRVRFADHTGEINAKIPVNVLEDAIGYSADQFKSMSADERASIRWRYLLEQCSTKIAVTPPRLIVLSLRRASPADPIPLY